MDTLNELNEKQREAVLETEGYLRVIAGAGSGKTKLLVSRYAYLVNEYGIDPANILCVTFTNKAAGEMRRRINAIIGDGAGAALITTYHGFCARLLRDDAEKLFLSRDFQIIDTTQQKTILGELFQKREWKLDTASFEKTLRDIGKYKTEARSEYVPNFCCPEPVQIKEQISNAMEEVIEEYMQRQKAVNALDFYDLLTFGLHLLETNEEVRSKWQEKLNYIMVDEFQDSSKLEMELVDILSGNHHNLMIVGDPDQNIYEWRGSDVRLLVDFDKAHEETKTVILDRNYRSSPQILRCANHLIGHNRLRLKKDLFTLRQGGVNVVHIHSKSDEKETEKIADLIRREVKDAGRKYSDLAILYRSGFLSRMVEKKLVEANIPYEIYGGVKFYQRMEVLDLIAYLRVIAYGDASSLKRIINKPRRRFGRTKVALLEELWDLERANGKSMDEVLAENLTSASFKNSGASELIDLITELRQEAGALRISEIVNLVSTRSGYEEYIRSLGDEERYENLMEFKRVADEFERNFGEEISLPEFLQQISLQSREDQDSEKDAVRLMTIHASKGLEFPVVFVIGFTEGIFPSSKTIEERKEAGLEEERRLCYVAITRAREELILMDSEGFSQGGIKKLPSRFLREIGANNYDRIGVISPELENESKAYAARLDSCMGDVVHSGFSVNETVEHHIFGKGAVKSWDPKRKTLVVQFENGQCRSLSAEYFTRVHQKPVALPIPPKEEPAVIMEEEKKPIPPWEMPDHEENPKIKLKQESADPEEEKALRDARQAAALDDETPDVEAKEVLFVPPKGGDKPPQNRQPQNDSPREPTSWEDEERTRDLNRRLAETPNLWDRDDVPKTGWKCVGVTDLGAPTGICQMCGRQIIRYVHHMVHPNYAPLDVGCVCAGKMEGDPEAAKKREREAKNRLARRESFIKNKWKPSGNGNDYKKANGHLIVLYRLKDGSGWKYAIDSKFRKLVFPQREDAIIAAFEELELMKRL